MQKKLRRKLMDGSSPKYPMIISHPNNVNCNYLDAVYAVMWNDFTSDWQTYGECLEEIKRGLA